MMVVMLLLLLLVMGVGAEVVPPAARHGHRVVEVGHQLVLAVA
jgi:hypothetical protein